MLTGPGATIARARNLRRAMSLPEALLWRELRHRPGGFKFRRQHPIGPYVVDFCCLSARFVVEVDGAAHDNIARAKFDERRVAFINENGFRVLRVSASRVLADAIAVAEAITVRAANPHHQPAAGPPPRSGEAF